MTEAITHTVPALRRQRPGGHRHCGAGLHPPGCIFLKEAVIRNSPNLASIGGFPDSGRNEPPFGNTGHIGDAGRYVDDLVLLTLGTGIGGGIVTNGKVLRGWRHCRRTRSRHRCSQRIRTAAAIAAVSRSPRWRPLKTGLRSGNRRKRESAKELHLDGRTSWHDLQAAGQYV
jgi:hypothetical protein